MADQRKKLIAIDGNSLLYRAFFAMRYLSTSSGMPTNALYGLTTMLLRILEEKPDYIVAAFDTAAPTFRHESYEKYKAHRKPTPDALVEQAPVARELVRAFSIPVVEVPGYEADDIIGALSVKATEHGIDTVIVTGDLDALQLVNDYVRVMTTLKGVSDTVVYGPEEVRARFSLAPEQMVDYKGLKGDPSDNIPGVPGIGDKTAVDLLKRFGSIDNILEHLGDLPEGKVKKTLEENSEMAVMSRNLATIVTDLPVDLEPEQFRSTEPDYEALRDLFLRLEFKTMLKRLPEVSKPEGVAKPKQIAVLGTCRRINSRDELKELVRTLERAGEFSLQCHTLDGKSIEAQIVGLSFCSGVNETAYVQVVDPARGNGEHLELAFDGPYQADIGELKAVLSSDRIVKYCHDSKLNHAALALRGVELRNVQFDTMLAAYLIDATRSSFEVGDVAFEQIGLELPGVTEKKSEVSADDVSVVCGEAEAIYRLRPVLDERLQRDELCSLFTDVEMPLAPILAEMELNGIAVDVEQLWALSTSLDVEIKNVERSVYDKAGEEFNIGSPKQLQSVLFEKMGLAASKKTKTGYSTSAAALEELAVDNPIVDDILKYRELTKLKSTYSDALPKLINPRTNRIHTSLNQAVTATGRLSSSNPNLQNIPVRSELGREIRKAFVATGDNVLLSADYSQIELRILAHVTGDENLIQAFRNDEDIHTATACTLFGVPVEDVTPEMRRRAKTINFAVIYGMADFTLSKTLGISVKEAKEYIETYFTRFPGVRLYTDRTIEQAREQKYVTTLLGRRRYMPDINAANRNVRQFAERAAVNMPIQGTAADIMKMAMINVHRALKADNLKSRMLLQVHDELLLEVVPGEMKDVSAHLKWGMELACELDVPLKVDVKAGGNWAEMQPVT